MIYLEHLSNLGKDIKILLKNLKGNMKILGDKLLEIKILNRRCWRCKIESELLRKERKAVARKCKGYLVFRDQICLGLMIRRRERRK